MTKVNEVFRNYRVTDAEMLQTSGVFNTLFQQDSAEFIGFDADFDAPFAENWTTAISSAEEASQDVMLIDQLAGLTKTVDDNMEEARNFYQKLKYYIEKAYPGNKPVQNEFGFNDYESARRSTPKFINFLTMLHAAGVKYTTELIAAGVTQEVIDQIITLRDALKDADQVQEVFKKNRPLETQTRVEKLNECWKFSKKVCKAGKIIFASDAAKYNQYLLPGEVAKPVEVV